MFELKNYQKNALKCLADYFDNARISSPTQAYKESLQLQGVTNPLYRTYDLGDIPYICLRLPTGGGKTVLASYAIRDVAFNYLFKKNPLVLWLVPSTKIAEQTLTCLQHPGHPYRQAIDEYFGGKVSVFAISDVVNIRPQDFDQKVVIVVGTLATLRITDTTGRRIYDHNEAYQPHFERLPKNLTGLDVIEEGKDKGKPKYSFANLSYLLKPLVIMDEAHNARTTLSFETLKRLNPSCIIELTATPDTTAKSGSNILYSVSALELKNENMIKLPIMLTEHQIWQEAVANTVMKRAELNELAKQETEYIRPIALYQAESKDREVTVEKLKQHLIDIENIDEKKIAIYTGAIKELNDVDLFSPKCEIEHIITVEALKEGWDCSFAYVFCSVANISSSRDVEQLLGRVLRMPYAKRRKVSELNCAYANVSSPSFARAANDLRDALVNKMGFEKLEAEAFVQASSKPGKDNPDQGDIFSHPEPETIEIVGLDVDKLSEGTKQSLGLKTIDGVHTVVIGSEIMDSEAEELLQAVPPKEAAKVQKAITTQRLNKTIVDAPKPKSDKPLIVPRLFKREDDYIDFLESDSIQEAGEWDLQGFKAELPDFVIRKSGDTFEITISESKTVSIKEDLSDEYYEHTVDLSELVETDLIIWLDRETRQTDIHQTSNLNFVRSIIAYLLEKKGYNLTQLFKAKFQLRTAIIELIKSYRKEAMTRGYQKLLFSDDKSIEVSFDHSFIYKPEDENYLPNHLYSGHYKFNKHLYNMVGQLNGEELDCAIALDRLPQVKHWVRNIELRHDSFWLPTSTDKFYPDFVAELNDGRILVIEYKGEMIASSDDTKEKDTIGQLWAKKSSGKGIFVLCTKDMIGKLGTIVK